MLKAENIRKGGVSRFVNIKIKQGFLYSKAPEQYPKDIKMVENVRVVVP